MKTLQPGIHLSNRLLKRLPHYHFYLKQLEKKHRDFVSNERLAADMKLTSLDVFEDLESIDNLHTFSKIYNVRRLLQIIESIIDPSESNTAVLVGAGNLGRALMAYDGFKALGLEIGAVFDNNSQLTGSFLNNKQVLPIDKMNKTVQRLGVKIGIITTPPEPAQNIANRMVNAGIKGIWNFSLNLIKVPENVVLRENTLYSDLIHLMSNINSNKDGRESIN